MIRPILLVSLAALAGTAATQESTEPHQDKSPLAAPNSPEAARMLDGALQKVLAFGRGTFTTTEKHDSATMRGVGIGFLGAAQTTKKITGGWSGDLIWADSDSETYVRRGNRQIAKGDGNWRLRRSKLRSGKAIPFTIDPALMITAISTLPAESRRVAHVSTGRTDGRDAVILSLVIENVDATDFSDSGAVPLPGTNMMIDFGGMDLPKSTHIVHLALYVDRENGDLLRIGAKVFEKNPMLANFQVAVQIGGAGQVDEEEEDEDEDEDDEEPAADGQQQWKLGFPVREPDKDESVVTYTVKFSKLGMTKAIELDESAKELLGLR